eukprot:scaffold89124_cov20-Tisochrysis_lutea.AAC.2
MATTTSSCDTATTTTITASWTTAGQAPVLLLLLHLVCLNHVWGGSSAAAAAACGSWGPPVQPAPAAAGPVAAPAPAVRQANLLPAGGGSKFKAAHDAAAADMKRLLVMPGVRAHDIREQLQVCGQLYKELCQNPFVNFCPCCRH